MVYFMMVFANLLAIIPVVYAVCISSGGEITPPYAWRYWS